MKSGTISDHRARVYHKRHFGDVRPHFVIFGLSLDTNKNRSQLVELIFTEVVDVSPGDTVLVKTGTLLADSDSRRNSEIAGKALSIRVASGGDDHFAVLERWVDGLGSGGLTFQRPVFHDGLVDDFLLNLKRKEEAKKSKKRGDSGKSTSDGGSSVASSSGIAKNAVRKGDPIAILQVPCASTSDRVVEYFNGTLLSAYTENRLVMLHQEEELQQKDDDTAAPDNKINTLFRDRVTRFLYTPGGMDSFLLNAVERVFLLKPAPQVPTAQIKEGSCTTNTPFKSVSLEEAIGEYVMRVGHAGLMSVADTPQRWIQCFPRRLETQCKSLLQAARDACLLENPDIANGATDDEGSLSDQNNDAAYAASLVYADGLYWLAAGVSKINVPHRLRTSKDVPCNAYWKLLEIQDRYLATRGPEVVRRYHGRSLAMDIGASPGGWSYCLAKTFHTRLTIAVDPASHMHDLVRGLMTGEDLEGKDVGESSAHRIQHWQMKGDEAITRLKDQHASSSGPQPSGHQVAIFVCDINADPEVAVSYLAEMKRHGLLERPCLAALTFKMTCKSRRDFAERKTKCLEILRNLDHVGLSDVEELHLFANTRLETTVIGQLL